ncbi:MAG: putative lipid II flippase FtsW [Myxococcales bacterium]|nr:putative lipid II flippase FtsW [Myxococcales bacterium]
MRKKNWFSTIWSDPWLMLVSIILTMIGVAMIYSTTHVMAVEEQHNAYVYLKKHAVSLALGFAGLLFFSQLPMKTLRQLAPWILLGVFGLLTLVLVPGFGVRAGGAIRWLKIAGIRVGQPAELAKLALIIFLARSLERKHDRVESFWSGYLPNVVVAGALVMLLMLQPDFGTSMLLLTLMAIILFVGGVPVRYLVGSGLLALPMVYLMLTRKAYRWKRITSFLDPFAPENIQDGAYQLVQSLKTIALGGLWGAGLGQSKQKLGHLPEAHTDFIFSIVSEELGLIGVLLIMAAFLFFVYRGFRIAMRARDLFSQYIALGLACMIGLQCLLNIGVVMGALPTKGMPLPFLSFARSSLIVVLCCVGILQRIEADTLIAIHRAKRKTQEITLERERKAKEATQDKEPASSAQRPSKNSKASSFSHA